MPLIIENRKYKRKSNKKQAENTKGLIEGQKLFEKPQKFSKKLEIYFLYNFENKYQFLANLKNIYIIRQK